MRLSILGPPGAGKGTQAKKIAGEYGLVHLSTGDLLRAAIREKSPLGRAAEGYVTSGRLVPDEIMIGVLEEFLKDRGEEPGFILDGFPRTLGQAEALDRLAEKLGQELSRVVQLSLSDEVAVERVAGRRICPRCGREYHVRFRPPKVTGKCDDDGADLVQREDDTEKGVRERLMVYHRQDDPLLEYYRKRGLLADVDADADVETVFERIQKALDGAAQTPEG